MLSITRPTATTILYTISTRAPATHLTTKLQRILVALLRLITAALVFTVLYCKAHTLDYAILRHHNPLHDTFPDSLAQHATWGPALAIALAVLYLCVRRPYTEESLLVIRGLGVQTSSSSGTYLSAARTRFIPTSAMQDIFLYEAFKGFEVKFYLAIVVEGEEDLVVVFPVGLVGRRVETCKLTVMAEDIPQAAVAGAGLERSKGVLV